MTMLTKGAVAIAAEDLISDTIDSYDKELREISLKVSSFSRFHKSIPTDKC